MKSVCLKIATLVSVNLLIVFFSAFTISAQTCISLMSSAAYTQDFDSLENTGTSSAVPSGWSFVETSGDDSMRLVLAPQQEVALIATDRRVVLNAPLVH